VDNIPIDLIEIQRTMQARSMDGINKFARSLRNFDRRIAAGAVGGALLIPSFQSSTLRLEMLAHATVAGCNGQTVPRQKDIAAWITEAGKLVGHLEDAAEDVFAARVAFEGHNYHVLEGLSEGGGYHLQLTLQVLEKMPGSFGQLRDGCRALLSLSNAFCSRADIRPFELGSESPIRRRISPTSFPTLRTLRGWVTFSSDDLDKIDVDPDSLRPFVLRTATQDIIGGYASDSALSRTPLLEFDRELVVALPTAIGPAIRSAIISACFSAGPAATSALRMIHLELQTGQLSTTPMINQIGSSPTALNLGPIVPADPVEIEPGYWMQLVLAVDDLSDFEDGGLAGTAGNSQAVELSLRRSIEAAKNRCESAPGFKAGLTYVIICGYGRGFMLGLSDHGANWFVEASSSYDAEVLGWRSDFSLSDLFRLTMVERDLASKRFEVRHMNGLLAQVGDALSNRGHLIPHEALPDGMPGGMIMAQTNAQLKLRVDHHKKFDLRAIPSPEGAAIIMRRDGSGSRSPGGISRLYLSVDEVMRGRMRAAWVKGNRTWWMETRPRSAQVRGALEGVFEAQRTWMERMAPILDAAIPELPDSLLWDLRIDPQPPTRTDELVPANADEISDAIEVLHDSKSGTITTVVQPGFWRGLSNPNNVAEATLVRLVLVGALRLVGRPEHEAATLAAEVVRSPYARQLHAFAPQDFRDHMRDTFDRRVARVSSLQDGAIRIGLGWSGVERPGGTVRGSSECTRALNAITVAAEEALCQDLAKFDRRQLIEEAVRNHEAAEVDARRWKRTAGAIIGLADDENVVRLEVAESIFKLNAVSLACRLLIEIGLHHCPAKGELAIADIDLSRLMAQALVIVHLGGYSDAIHYGAMKPEIRISPAGEVQIDVGFSQAVMDPIGKDFANTQINRERSAYHSYLVEPDLPSDAKKQGIDHGFEAAWMAEFGADLLTFRTVVDEFENICMQQGKAWMVLPWAELCDMLESRVKGASTVVTAFESLPRKSWKVVPPGFDDLDRQPWRFRRRLSVARRPLIRLGEGDNADVLVAPGIVREALASTVINMYEGNYEVARLSSRAMRKWSGKIAGEQGAKFQEDVAVKLRELGWTVRTSVKFGEILGRDPEKDLGDIDVLAWRSDGRVALLECKRLSLAKTPSEVAKQLSKFRGVADENGVPDLLARHLNRWKIARENAGALSAFTKVSTTAPEAGLVFSNTVPMQFALQGMSEKLSVNTIDDLASF
jgi:hypothetical protein